MSNKSSEEVFDFLQGYNTEFRTPALGFLKDILLNALAKPIAMTRGFVTCFFELT